MRAKEFVSEGKAGSFGGRKGKLTPEQEATMPRAHKFAGTADRIYDYHRAMMAVAGSNGKEFEHEPTEESWIGRSNMANPYTEIEHKMLHHAYNKLGIPIDDAVSDHSREPDTINKSSPVRGFKGYPR